MAFRSYPENPRPGLGGGIYPRSPDGTDKAFLRWLGGTLVMFEPNRMVREPPYVDAV